MSDESARNHQYLVRAQNLVAWAAIGLVMPLVGIIIAILAWQRLNYVTVTADNQADVERVKSRAGMWIIVSILAGFCWVAAGWLLRSNQEGLL
jgi:hypothetical protein